MPQLGCEGPGAWGLGPGAWGLKLQEVQISVQNTGRRGGGERAESKPRGVKKDPQDPLHRHGVEWRGVASSYLPDLDFKALL